MRSKVPNSIVAWACIIGCMVAGFALRRGLVSCTDGRGHVRTEWGCVSAEAAQGHDACAELDASHGDAKTHLATGDEICAGGHGCRGAHGHHGPCVDRSLGAEGRCAGAGFRVAVTVTAIAPVKMVGAWRAAPRWSGMERLSRPPDSLARLRAVRLNV